MLNARSLRREIKVVALVWLPLITGCIGWVVYLIASMPPSESPGENALRQTTEYVETLNKLGTSAPESGHACKELLLEALRANPNQYEITLVGETLPGEAHDQAVVRVVFPDGTIVESSFYRTTLENCITK